jgi:hypothetical protein
MMSDLSPEAIDRRLKVAARLAAPLLAAECGTAEASRVKRQSVVDLSPEAIDARLRQVSELRAVCLELGRLKDR